MVNTRKSGDNKVLVYKGLKGRVANKNYECKQTRISCKQKVCKQTRIKCKQKV